MKLIRKNYYTGAKEELTFVKHSYTNNDVMAIQIVADGCESFGFLTTNLEEKANENCIWADSNNCPSDIIDNLVGGEYLTPTGRMSVSGFSIYSEYKVNEALFDDDNVLDSTLLDDEDDDFDFIFEYEDIPF